ncbi:MAG: hypothetical protein KAY65_16150 [Planctomycetes bacterium]|nr:hypothetical protein [Planctomycetota bacterium]
MKAQRTKGAVLAGNGPQSCIIDCGGTSAQNHRAFHFHSGEGENTIVQGFTIRGGVAYKGGAVLCTNSSPKFVNCVFHANQAQDDDTGGGAIYNENSSPTLIDYLFTANSATNSGGAVSNDGSKQRPGTSNTDAPTKKT